MPPMPRRPCPGSFDWLVHEAWERREWPQIIDRAQQVVRYRTRGDENRGPWNQLRSQMKMYSNGDSWDRMCRCIAIVVEKISERTRADAEEHAQIRSWKDAGWKALSQKGFDMLYGKIEMDYGNKPYRALLLAATTHGLFGERIRMGLDDLARVWPSLTTHHTDTKKVLSMNGDIIEILLALCRAEDRALRAEFEMDNTQWCIMYNDIAAWCRMHKELVVTLRAHLRADCERLDSRGYGLVTAELAKRIARET